MNMNGTRSYLYTDDQDRPLVTCPVCGSDLTAERGIELTLSIGGVVVEGRSHLDRLGYVEDTVDDAIAKGFHSGTSCAKCGHLLVDYEEEVVILPAIPVKEIRVD